MYQQPPSNPNQPLYSSIPPYQYPSSYNRPPPRNRWTRRPGCWVLIVGVIVVLSLGLCIFSVSSISSTQQGTTPVTPTQQTALATATPAHRAVVILPTTMPTNTPTPKPTPILRPTTAPTKIPTEAPTQPPVATTAPVRAGVNGNPWGYDFTPGNFIRTPDPGFCYGPYFVCIASFAKGNGYVIECADTEYSKSGGIQGSCSRHGGDLQILYSH